MTKSDVARAMAAQAPGGSIGVDPNAHERIQKLQRELAEQRTHDSSDTPRVAHEANEQKKLADLAQLRWWFPGFEHHAHERPTGTMLEQKRFNNRGARPGWPDTTLHIPGEWRVLAACELKSPTLRPVRAVPDEWWLTCEYAREDGKRYGLTGHQAQRLRILAGCGYKTLVAFSGEEAFRFFDRLAGPKPAGFTWPYCGAIDDWRHRRRDP